MEIALVSGADPSDTESFAPFSKQIEEASMKFKMSELAVLLTLFPGIGIALHAQRPTDIVKWTATITKSTKTSTNVALSATVADGWHVYALSQGTGGPNPLKISVPSGSAFVLKAPVADAGVTKHYDTSFKMETVYYLKTINLNVALEGISAAPPATFPIDVRFQACSDRLCLPPYTAHLSATPKDK